MIRDGNVSTDSYGSVFLKFQSTHLSIQLCISLMSLIHGILCSNSFIRCVSPLHKRVNNTLTPLRQVKLPYVFSFSTSGPFVSTPPLESVVLVKHPRLRTSGYDSCLWTSRDLLGYSFPRPLSVITDLVVHSPNLKWESSHPSMLLSKNKNLLIKSV